MPRILISRVGTATNRRARIIAIGLTFAAVLTAGTPASARQSQAVPGAPGVELGPPRNDFYDGPARLPGGPHGSLIWARSVKAFKGADAWKVLYISKLQSGERVPTSGLVIAPEGQAPSGRRPVLAWAHGTEGNARQCAPSMAPNPARGLVDYFDYDSRFGQDIGIPALRAFLDAGYVVTATDYQGLGTRGQPEYTVARSETNNVFDSVLAARGLKAAHAGKRVVVLGWSQGGGAAAFSGQEPNLSYAGELRLLGAAELAPAADLGPQFAGQVLPGPVSTTSPWHAAALRLNVYGGFAAAYPELDPADGLTEDGLAAFPGTTTQCINHFAYTVQNAINDPERLFRPLPSEWQERFDENTAGNVTTEAPLLVMQGTADTVINPHSTTNYVRRACGFDQPITYTRYEGATHQTIPLVAKPEYVPWIADRFAGLPAPDNCSSLPPPGS